MQAVAIIHYWLLANATHTLGKYTTVIKSCRVMLGMQLRQQVSEKTGADVKQ